MTLLETMETKTFWICYRSNSTPLNHLRRGILHAHLEAKLREPVITPTRHLRHTFTAGSVAGLAGAMSLR